MDFVPPEARRTRVRLPYTYMRSARASSRAWGRNPRQGVAATRIARSHRDPQSILLELCLKPPKSALGTARTAPSRFSHSRTRPRALLAPGLARGGTTDSQFLSVRVPLVSSCASCHHILSDLGSGSCLLKFPDLSKRVQLQWTGAPARNGLLGSELDRGGSGHTDR